MQQHLPLVCPSHITVYFEKKSSTSNLDVVSEHLKQACGNVDANDPRAKLTPKPSSQILLLHKVWRNVKLDIEACGQRRRLLRWPSLSWLIWAQTNSGATPKLFKTFLGAAKRPGILLSLDFFGLQISRFLHKLTRIAGPHQQSIPTSKCVHIQVYVSLKG